MFPKKILFFSFDQNEYTTSLIIKMTLSHWGNKILGTATTEEKAISMLNILSPDIIIMDIVPGYNLNDSIVINEIKKRYIPVIYQCSLESMHQVEPIMKDYIYGIVTKPIDVNNLHYIFNSVFECPLPVETNINQLIYP